MRRCRRKLNVAYEMYARLRGGEMTRLTVVSKWTSLKNGVFPTAFEDLKSGNIAAIF